MARLEELTHGASVKGILADGLATIVDVKWHGSDVVEVIVRTVTENCRTLKFKSHGFEKE